jgi:O-antigen ligase
MNFARSAFVGIFASVSMILFLKGKKNFALFSGLVGLTLAYSPACNLMLDIFTNRVITGSYARFVVWKDAIDVFREHFFTGIGSGNYFFYPSFRGRYGQMASAHNNYLQIAAEMGIFGLLVFLGFLFIALRETISLYRLTSNKLFKSLSLAFAGSIVGISASSIFGDFIFPARENAGHNSIRATIYFWILLGLVMGAKRIVQKESDQKDKSANLYSKKNNSYAR